MSQIDPSKIIVGQIDRVHDHARKCTGSRKIRQKDGTSVSVPCPVCATNQEFMRTVPSDLLSKVLAEPIYHAKVQMATLVVESCLIRGGHNTQRSKRDFLVGIRLLKNYQDAGGKLRNEINQ